MSNTEQDFSKDAVGTRVWDFVCGWGTIESISDPSEFPICVKFDIKISSNTNIGYFMKNGRFTEYSAQQRLFYDEIKFEIPKKPLPKLEVDTKVFVRDTDSEEWEKRYFSHFGEDGKIICFDFGATSWSSNNILRTSWNHWKLEENL